MKSINQHLCNGYFNIRALGTYNYNSWREFRWLPQNCFKLPKGEKTKKSNQAFSKYEDTLLSVYSGEVSEKLAPKNWIRPKSRFPAVQFSDISHKPRPFLNIKCFRVLEMSVNQKVSKLHFWSVSKTGTRKQRIYSSNFFSKEQKTNPRKSSQIQWILFP